MELKQVAEDIRNKHIRGSKTRQQVSEALHDMQSIGYARTGFSGAIYFIQNNFRVEASADGMAFIVYADAQ